MVKGKTGTGFNFEVDKDQLSNAEFLETFADVQKGNSLAVFELIGILLGPTQKKSLYDHCRDEKGMVPVDVVSAEITDIISGLTEATETKN